MAEKKTATLAESTARKIIDYIISKKMMPGDKLPTEAEFLKQWDISRSTLREGFKLLTARNILEIRQGSGTFISPKRGIPDDPLGLTFIYDDNKLVLDMLDVRLIFEPQVAALAAVYATPEQKKAIAEQANELERCIANGESYAAADSRFHRLIAEASGNRLVADMTVAIRASLRKPILDAIRGVADWPALSGALQAEHHAIFAAIEQHDGPLAADLTERHIRAAYEALPALRDD